MPIALAVVAVLAIAFLVMLVMARSSAAEFRTQAEARETALVAERDELKERSNRLEGDLTDAKDEIAELKKQLADTSAEVEKVTGELEEARTLSDEQASTIDSQSSEIEHLTEARDELQGQLEAAEAEAAAATARNVGFTVRGEEIEIDAVEPATLWALELARSQRTWRTSVAPNPSAEDDPFEGTDDPVRRAIEIEAAALREDVGAHITISWEASEITEPARQHLVVRVAQELLEAAARAPEPSRLVVTGDEEVNLRLEAADEGDEVPSIIPPRIRSELVDIREETGVSITVKAPVS